MTNHTYTITSDQGSTSVTANSQSAAEAYIRDLMNEGVSYSVEVHDTEEAWIPIPSGNLIQGDVFHFEDESPAMAHIVHTPVIHDGYWARFTTHAERYAHNPDHSEGLSIIEDDTLVYVRATV